MKYSELLHSFYKMEVEERLFEVKDKNGVCVWDIVRYYAFTSLLWPNYTEKNISSTTTLLSFGSKIYKLFLNLWIVLFVRRKYFFFLNSRNKQPNTGLFFDQNAYDTLKLLPTNECLINEIYPTGGADAYNSITTFCSSGILYTLLKYNLSKYDFSRIKSIIDKHFNSNTISVNRLNDEYKSYQIERRFYKIILRMTSAKLLFVTQGGIRKGLFAAAKELKIPSIEFNHGIVYDGHMAYSYPRIKNINNICPDYIFALSSFWFRDMYLPNTKVLPVGNNYFYPIWEPRTSPEVDKSILVISANVFGFTLKNFLIDLFESYPCFLEYEFIFKLHPNEFNQIDEYRDYFKQYANVSVITNEKSVPQCLQDCATMFTIQSTATFEALQMKRKVVLLKKLSYETMQVLFNNKNLHLVETPEDFLTVIQAPIADNMDEYFSKFDSNKAKQFINNIMIFHERG